MFYGYSDFLTRNLLYTALTRARKKLIIIGREATVRNMIDNARISQRYTALDHEIKTAKATEQAAAGSRRSFQEELDLMLDDLMDIFPEEEP